MRFRPVLTCCHLYPHAAARRAEVLGRLNKGFSNAMRASTFCNNKRSNAAEVTFSVKQRDYVKAENTGHCVIPMGHKYRSIRPCRQCRHASPRLGLGRGIAEFTQQGCDTRRIRINSKSDKDVSCRVLICHVCSLRALGTAGIEPTWPFGQRILSPSRLPVPPRAQQNRLHDISADT